MSVPFVHLHVHTKYSVLDGLCDPFELARTAKALGMKSIAITDHRNLYGVVNFTKACTDKKKGAGIKPIYGCEIEETEDRTIHNRAAMAQLGYDNYHLVILAMNEEGYQNMVEIVSDAATIGNFDKKERTDLTMLQGRGKGLIAMSACLGGRISQLLLKGEYEKAKEWALKFQSIFEHFYLEVQHNTTVDQAMVNQLIIKLSQETGIPLVATKDIHYVFKEDGDIHDTILCVQTGALKSDPNRFRFAGGYDYYLASPDEMEQWAIDNNIPMEALENTVKIADLCDVKLKMDQRLMPHVSPPDGYDMASYLRKLCYDALIEYAGTKTINLKQYLDRLNMELDVIIGKGYPDYFLVLQDIIDFCRKVNILTGPGRGSAAGALVTFLLGITQLDPIEHNLLFERFLNPERNSMPDIDVDFDYDRREEVIEYIRQKYGEDHVAQIITYGTMGVKSGIKDIMRALGYEFKDADFITKLVPDKMPDQSDVTLDVLMDIALHPGEYDFGGSIDQMVMISQKLRLIMSDYLDVYDVLERSEGMVRSIGIHAAGVVIAPGPVLHFSALCKGPAKATLPVVQLDMKAVEDVGLVKMDILALRNLMVINHTKKTAGITIDLNRLPLNDPAIYKDLRDGYTYGVFQLGSSGITHLIKQVAPYEFDQVVDVLGAYRPGPLDAKMDNGMTMVEQYVENTHDPENIHYEHPDLAPILSRSKGVILWQEQVMEICRKIAGYTLGGADLFRRAIGKKDIDLLKSMRSQFVYGLETKEVDDPDNPGQKKKEQVKSTNPGAVPLGYDEKFANHLFDQILKFAGYSFNRSHSAAYALLTYQTAWLKHYHPVEYMAALLSSYEKTEDIVATVNECRRMGIDILPPDINTSDVGFTVELLPNGKKGIRYGLRSIAEVGDAIVENIKSVRPFKDLEDFFNKVTKRIVNKKVVTNLIKAGAFDPMNPNRHAVWNEYFFDLRKDKEGVGEHMVPRMDELEYTDYLKLSYEKETMGMYISGHPLGDLPFTRWGDLFDRQNVELGGVITKTRVHKDKNGNEMCFFTIETQEDSRDVVVFAKTFSKLKGKVTKDYVVVVKGKKDGIKDSLVCEDVMVLYKMGKEQKAKDDKAEAKPKKPRAPKKPKDEQIAMDFGPAPVREDPLAALLNGQR